MNFEMANTDSPEQIIAATQRSLIEAIRNTVKDIKSDVRLSKQPGLTWEQIDYLLIKFGEKTPKIIVQDHPV